MAGSSDWGTYQVPGALKSMVSTSCAQFQGVELIDGAGHWVQQEQSQRVNALLFRFIDRHASWT
jgi:pimeloyl-ACP methyl ester carboxylesterase